MKIIKIFIIIICIFFIQKSDLYSQAPTNGLIAYYPFTGNANDASGNGRNGVTSGGIALTTDRYGNTNQAYSFNGSNSSITIGWGLLQGNSTRSMSVWFKTNVYPTTPQYFLSWGGYATNNVSALGTFADASGKYLGYVGYNNDIWVKDQAQYYDNRWHNIIVTFDAIILKVFLDGALVTSRATTLNTLNSNLFIGNMLNSIEFFNGSLDDIRVYNRGLSDTEVQQLFRSEITTSTTSDVIKLGFDKFIHATGDNTFVGLRSGALANSSGNTFLGKNTGSYNTGSYNVFMGLNSGQQNSTGESNTFIGSFSGQVNTTGKYNTFMGHASGNKNTTGESNSFFGLYSGYTNTTGYANTFLGRSAGEANTVGYANTFVGHASGFKTTIASDNAFLGYYAGSENVNGLANTFIGSKSGGYNIQGGSNTFVGYASGWKNTASDNVAIGRSAGAFNTIGTKNTFIGTLAGLGVENMNTGSNNTFAGESSGLKISSGSNNTFIGKSSGFENTTGIDNAFLGKDAGVANSSGGSNTFMGKGAGYGNTVGSFNTAIGLNAGFENITGGNNVFLGREAIPFGTNKANLQNSVAIGSYAKVSIDNAIVLGDFANTNLKVGIGMPDPQFKLDVKGPINIRGINGGLGELKFMSYNFLRGDKNFNSAIGFLAEVDSNYHHSTAIGYKAFANADNVLVLGGINEDAVNVGIGNTAPKDNLEITSGRDGKSGLMFTNLNSETAISSNTNQVLSVDKMGRVGLYGISAGNIQLKVNSENDWADKVFSSDYKLMPIGELEKYVQNNQHLPNIPSATEMKEKGISVESMSAKTLEKVEELTLYMIEMKNELEAVKKEVVELKNKNRDLEKALKRRK